MHKYGKLLNLAGKGPEIAPYFQTAAERAHTTHHSIAD
jgi:hypothetical protein